MSEIMGTETQDQDRAAILPPQQETGNEPLPPQISDLDWHNIFLPSKPSLTAHYTPSTGHTSNQKQEPIPEIYAEAAALLRDALTEETEKILSSLKHARPHATIWDIESFQYSAGEISLRVTPIQTIDGLEFVLRKLSTTVLDEDQLDMPNKTLDIINKWLTKPGITLIGGRYGTRKTTHCYAYLKHHLLTYGGVAFIVDAPAEAQFSAEHLPYAHAIQIDLNTHPDPDRRWNHANAMIRKSSATIVYGGEISTPDAARFLIQQAHTGRPVIANLHGENLFSTIGNILELGSKSNMQDFRESLASSIVGITNQTVINNKPHVEILQFANARELCTYSEEELRNALSDNTDEGHTILQNAFNQQNQALTQRK